MAGFLGSTLWLWATQPFCPRTANCVLSVTDYAEAATRRQAPERPHDLGPVARQRLWDSEAELLAYCTGLFDSMGLIETVRPERGDIALVHDLAPTLTAAICLGGGKWAGRSEAGLVAASARPVIAWVIPAGGAA